MDVSREHVMSCGKLSKHWNWYFEHRIGRVDSTMNKLRYRINVHLWEVWHVVVWSLPGYATSQHFPLLTQILSLYLILSNYFPWASFSLFILFAFLEFLFCCAIVELSTGLRGRNNSNQQPSMHGGLDSLFIKSSALRCSKSWSEQKKAKSQRHSLRVPDEFIISLLCHKQLKSLCYQKVLFCPLNCCNFVLYRFCHHRTHITDTSPNNCRQLSARDIKVNWHVYGARSYYFGNLYFANMPQCRFLQWRNANEIYDLRLRRLLPFDATRHFILRADRFEWIFPNQYLIHVIYTALLRRTTTCSINSEFDIEVNSTTVLHNSEFILSDVRHQAMCLELRCFRWRRSALAEQNFTKRH